MPATVSTWRRRFVDRRLDGLVDEPRPGVPRSISDVQVEAVIVATLKRTRKDATHWSRASMAAQNGLSRSTVGADLAGAVRQARRGLMRTSGAAPRRLARPLAVEEIRQIIGDIDRSTPIGIRDAAIILLGYASAMRRAEIVALTLADIEPKPAGLLAAMRFDSVVWARSLALVPNDDLQCPHDAELGNHPRATGFRLPGPLGGG